MTSSNQTSQKVMFFARAATVTRSLTAVVEVTSVIAIITAKRIAQCAVANMAAKDTSPKKFMIVGGSETKNFTRHLGKQWSQSRGCHDNQRSAHFVDGNHADSPHRFQDRNTMTTALAEASEVLKIAEAFPQMTTVRISKDVLRALIDAARAKQ